MLDLIRSEFRRFFRSRTLYLCIAVCAFIGWYIQYNAKDYGNSDDIYLLGFLAVQAGAFSLIIGSQFSCKAVRNKLICGYTKAQIYFSELIVTLAASLLTYAAFIIPLFGLHEVVEKTSVTAADAAEMFLCILAVNIAMNVITVAVSFVFSAKAALSAVLSIGVAVGVSFVGVVCYHELDRPEFYISSYLEEELKYIPEELKGDEFKSAERVLVYEEPDGTPVYEYVIKEPNELYIKRGTAKFYFLRTIDLLCPYNMLGHINREASDFLTIYDRWVYPPTVDDEESQEEINKSYYYKRPWDLGKRMGAYLALSVFVTAAGCLIFSKKDMR